MCAYIFIFKTKQKRIYGSLKIVYYHAVEGDIVIFKIKVVKLV